MIFDLSWAAPANIEQCFIYNIAFDSDQTTVIREPVEVTSSGDIDDRITHRELIFHTDPLLFPLRDIISAEGSCPSHMLELVGRSRNGYSRLKTRIGSSILAIQTVDTAFKASAVEDWVFVHVLFS